ncbi:MAG: PAS domain S-box protein [Pelovirga sp.]
MMTKLPSDHHEKKRSQLPLIAFVVVVVWTLMIASLGSWHYYQKNRAVLENAHTAARYSLNRDMLYRRWLIAHGSAYVPVTGTITPSPFLSHLPSRDLVTETGDILTLIDHSTMSRQVHRMADKRMETRGHVFSSNPLRPENSPDRFETEAIQAFKQGAEEWSALISDHDASYLRLMQPLLAESGCLPCHGEQGFVEGEILGGISASVPWEPYRNTAAAALRNYSMGYGSLWLLGLVFTFMTFRLVQRRVVERDIQKQQRFTQDVLDSVSAHIAVLDYNGVIVAVNEPWRRFAARNAVPAEAPVPRTDVGTHYLDICRQAEEADSEGVFTGIEAVMAGRLATFRHEYPCHSPDEERWFEMTVMPLSTEDGGVVISHTTITERVLAEQNTETAKERLRRGQMYANIGTWEWNIASGELFWTERIAPLFGYPQNDLQTSYDNFLAAVHPDDRQAVIAAVNACIEEDQPYDIEHRVVWPDGTVHWLLERGAVQHDSNGNPLLMLGVVQNIDDRKAAEETLQIFKHVVNSVVDGVLVINTSGIIELVNPAASTIFGYDQQVLPGKNLNILMPDPIGAKHNDYIQHYLVGHESQILDRQVEVTGKRADGTEFPMEVAVSEIHIGSTRYFVGLLRDISVRKQAELALITAREEADRANRAKSEFLSSMSHELRTPMNAILGFGQLMQYGDTLSEEHQDSVNYILKAGNHLLELINGVLDLAKVESGNIDLSLEPVAVCALLDDCLALVGPMADRDNITVRHQQRQGAKVRADRTRLKQVLLNLLSNAIKYNRAGGQVSIDVQAEGDNQLCILITDTGQGIPQDRLADLFQPFNRLDAENSEIAGTGIGLSITRGIVEMMAGTVGVKSEVGVGSTFWVKLPLAAHGEPDSERELTADNETDSGFDPEGSYSLLYIEDNPANLKLVAQLLGQVTNIHLFTAHTPERGIELALAHRPDLILLDINLPGMDGYQVLEALKKETSLQHIPVIAITANAMPRDIERGKAAGFVDYLTKPLDITRFMDTVNRYLDTKAG